MPSHEIVMLSVVCPICGKVEVDRKPHSTYIIRDEDIEAFAKCDENGVTEYKHNVICDSCMKDESTYHKRFVMCDCGLPVGTVEITDDMYCNRSAKCPVCSEADDLERNTAKLIKILISCAHNEVRMIDSSSDIKAGINQGIDEFISCYKNHIERTGFDMERYNKSKYLGKTSEEMQGW